MKKETAIRSRKRFGQHFLVDYDVIDRIIEMLNLKVGDHVLEIGPGRGALTKSLMSFDVNMSAIEIDRDLVSELRRDFPDLYVIEADVMKYDLSIAEGKRVVGNLPYNLSTPLLNKLFEQPGIIDMTFMLQKEVVERLVSSPSTKAWGRLSVIAQYHCKIDELLKVARTAFVPRPRVDSAIVRLTPTERNTRAMNVSVFRDIVRVAFMQRRKRLSNSLKLYELDWHDLDIDSGLRAENLDVKDFVTIANSLITRS